MILRVLLSIFFAITDVFLAVRTRTMLHDENVVLNETISLNVTTSIDVSTSLDDSTWKDWSSCESWKEECSLDIKVCSSRSFVNVEINKARLFKISTSNCFSRESMMIEFFVKDDVTKIRLFRLSMSVCFSKEYSTIEIVMNVEIDSTWCSKERCLIEFSVETNVSKKRSTSEVSERLSSSWDSRIIEIFDVVFFKTELTSEASINTVHFDEKSLNKNIHVMHSRKKHLLHWSYAQDLDHLS
jgi:hypothetical protein